MPSFWITTSGDDIATSNVVTLNNGKTVDLSHIPGNGFVAPRIGQINAAIQAAADTRIPLSQLPADDPDKTIDPATSGVPYGRVHMYWGDANGNRATEGAQATHLCCCHTKVWIEYIDGKIVPHSNEVM